MGVGEGSYLNDVNDAQVRFFRCEVLSLHEGQCHLIPLKNQNNVLPFRRFSNAKLWSVQLVLFGPGTAQEPLVSTFRRMSGLEASAGRDKTSPLIVWVYRRYLR